MTFDFKENVQIATTSINLMKGLKLYMLLQHDNVTRLRKTFSRKPSLPPLGNYMIKKMSAT